MASAAATPTACTARGFERVAARRSARAGGRSGFPDRGPVRVVCRTTRFSEQFGDAGAPKPGTLQSPPLYVKRTLREGQTVRHPGTVIVLGDVNQNSEVIAGGDVFVWGSLRGDVVAGSKGDQRAKIFSLDFRPSSVVIGGVRRANPASETGAAGATSRATGVPQVAEVIEGRGVGVMTNAVRTSAHDSESGRAEKKAGRSIIVSPANGAAARLAEDASRRSAAVAAASAARKASNVTGAYIAFVGLALLFFPAKTFGLLFDVEAITDAWIRVFGILCVAFGVYYVGAAYGDGNGWGARGFYFSTVVGRLFVFFAFLALVGAGWHPEPKLLVLGFVNLIGALAMWRALGGKKKKGDTSATAEA